MQNSSFSGISPIVPGWLDAAPPWGFACSRRWAGVEAHRTSGLRNNRTFHFCQTRLCTSVILCTIVFCRIARIRVYCAAIFIICRVIVVLLPKTFLWSESVSFRLLWGCWFNTADWGFTLSQHRLSLVSSWINKLQCEWTPFEDQPMCK